MEFSFCTATVNSLHNKGKKKRARKKKPSNENNDDVKSLFYFFFVFRWLDGGPDWSKTTQKNVDKPEETFPVYKIQFYNIKAISSRRSHNLIVHVNHVIRARYIYIQSSLLVFFLFYIIGTYISLLFPFCFCFSFGVISCKRAVCKKKMYWSESKCFDAPTVD